MPWKREEKIFCVTTYSETKTYKTVSKQINPINDLLLRQETQKRLHVLEGDIKTIKRKILI